MAGLGGQLWRKREHSVCCSAGTAPAANAEGGIGVGAAVIVGFGLMGGRFLESVARQPELGPMLQTRMFIIAGLLDAVPIIGIAIAFLLIFL